MRATFCPWLLYSRRPLSVNELWRRYCPEMSFDAVMDVLPALGVRIFLDEWGSLFVYRIDIVKDMLRICSLLSRDIPLRDLPRATLEVYHSGIKVSEYLRMRFDGHIR